MTDTLELVVRKLNIYSITIYYKVMEFIIGGPKLDYYDAESLSDRCIFSNLVTCLFNLVIYLIDYIIID